MSGVSRRFSKALYTRGQKFLEVGMGYSNEAVSEFLRKVGKWDVLRAGMRGVGPSAGLSSAPELSHTWTVHMKSDSGSVVVDLQSWSMESVFLCCFLI